MAGFIDGEGCVRWTGGPQLEITNTHLHALEEMQEITGGSITQTNNGTSKGKDRKCYRLTLYGKKAEDLLLAVFPYLIIKRLQASVILDMAASRRVAALTPSALSEGLRTLKIDKMVAFDTRSDDEV